MKTYSYLDTGKVMWDEKHSYLDPGKILLDVFFSRTCYQCSWRDDSRRKDGAGSCGRMMNTMGCGSWKFERIREHNGMTTGEWGDSGWSYLHIWMNLIILFFVEVS